MTENEKHMLAVMYRIIDSRSDFLRPVHEGQTHVMAFHDAALELTEEEFEALTDVQAFGWIAADNA